MSTNSNEIHCTEASVFLNVPPQRDDFTFGQAVFHRLLMCLSENLTSGHKSVIYTQDFRGSKSSATQCRIYAYDCLTAIKYEEGDGEKGGKWVRDDDVPMSKVDASNTIFNNCKFHTIESFELAVDYIIPKGDGSVDKYTLAVCNSNDGLALVWALDDIDPIDMDIAGDTTAPDEDLLTALTTRAPDYVTITEVCGGRVAHSDFGYDLTTIGGSAFDESTLGEESYKWSRYEY